VLLKRIAAEYQFRRGRREKDVAMLQLAARNAARTNRAAIELAKLGVPDQICGSLLNSLDTLRTYADQSPMSEDTVEVLQLALEHLKESRGQFFQDVAALHFSGRKRNGFFVEVGTGDGQRLSNSYMLEKCYGWQGLLFEPNRQFHQSISQCRTATLDRRAAYSQDGQQLTFVENALAGELSSLSNYAESDSRQRGHEYVVDCVTLNTAFSCHQVPKQIDFLSLDTEGSELDVLAGLDLDEYNVQFLVIEHNGDLNKKRSIDAHLSKYGYREVCPEVSCIDSWMVRD
jgi:FkbM family methyltransferase